VSGLAWAAVVVVYVAIGVVVGRRCYRRTVLVHVARRRAAVDGWLDERQAAQDVHGEALASAWLVLAVWPLWLLLGVLAGLWRVVSRLLAGPGVHR
jgi:hypothetical protein